MLVQPQSTSIPLEKLGVHLPISLSSPPNLYIYIIMRHYNIDSHLADNFYLLFEHVHKKRKIICV
jgi:hypothetical protein